MSMICDFIDISLERVDVATGQTRRERRVKKRVHVALRHHPIHVCGEALRRDLILSGTIAP